MIKASIVLLLFAALCFAQAPPVLTPSSGFEVPSPGLCVGPPNIGSVYNRLGDPAVGYAGLYTCEQIGPTTAGGGSYGWVGARNAIQLQGRPIATTAPTDTQVLTWDATAGNWKPGTGGGGGGVTSVGLVGTANQLTVTGTSPITTSGSWTISIPTNPTLPGTTTGTFSGNLTGNVTGNASTASAVAVGGITGLGTNVGTFLTTPSGANFNSTLTTPLPITSALATTVNSVNLNGSGGFTCNFSLGYVCLVNQNGDATNPLIATISNLPTNAVVWFVFNINGVRGITWPSNVLCNLGDAFSQCPTVNGFTSGSGKWPFAFWSDGTNAWASGDSGYLQTVRAAHVDVGTLQLVGTLPADFASTPGSIQLLFGSQIHNNPNCSSSASPADCTSFNTPVGSVVIAAGDTSVVVDTSAVGANSQIFVQPDSGLGTKLSVTCNAAAPTGMVITRSAGTSFTITVGVAPVMNPFCFSYFIMN